MAVGAPWTDERIDRVKSLWQQGQSAGQIASRMGGVTRNAVLGKLSRLGMLGQRECSSGALVAVERKAKAVRTQVRAPKPRPAPAALPVTERRETIVTRDDPPPHERKALIDLPPGACHWFIGDPKQTLAGFCGRSMDGLGPYCATHIHRSINHDGMKRARQSERT